MCARVTRRSDIAIAYRRTMRDLPALFALPPALSCSHAPSDALRRPIAHTSEARRSSLKEISRRGQRHSVILRFPITSIVPPITTPADPSLVPLAYMIYSLVSVLSVLYEQAQWTGATRSRVRDSLIPSLTLYPHLVASHPLPAFPLTAY